MVRSTVQLHGELQTSGFSTSLRGTINGSLLYHVEPSLTQMLPGFPPLPNQTGCPIVSEPGRVSARLLELHPSLDEALLREVSEHGYRARLEATALHPTTAAGSYHWIASVYAIRSMLAERKWELKDSRNCPFIVSPERTVAIVVMTGDPDTGRPNGNPTNQAEKGSVLKQAVAQNQAQLKLFDAGSVSPTLAGPKEATQLWVLLYHVAVGPDGKDEVRVELSLPSQFERKQIVGWRERIILRSIRPDGELGGIQDDSPTGPIDVPVERRTGT
ncbi:hypothetical protein DFQ28_001250 [Apophysomyces sp. BC1034]|nr:hypothetical protein DFQ28_001250 [Apophysomyces sp. BC1034]